MTWGQIKASCHKLFHSKSRSTGLGNNQLHKDHAKNHPFLMLWPHPWQRLMGICYWISSPIHYFSCHREKQIERWTKGVRSIYFPTVPSWETCSLIEGWRIKISFSVSPTLLSSQDILSAWYDKRYLNVFWKLKKLLLYEEPSCHSNYWEYFEIKI